MIRSPFPFSLSERSQKHAPFTGFRVFVVLCFLTFTIHHNEAKNLSMGNGDQPSFPGLLLNGTEIFNGGDATQDIRLKPDTISPDRAALLLRFDQKIPGLLRDETGNFYIENANYTRVDDSRIMGGALFNRKDNQIIIRPHEDIWPGKGVMQDFTIQFWMKPIHFFRKNIIFSKTGYLDGSVRGMEIMIQDSHLQVQFNNFFEDGSGGLRDLRLIGKKHVRINEWVHMALSYRESDGKMILYLDGREEDVVFAGDRYGVYRGAFHPLDDSPLIIGKKWSGIIDEFIIQGRFIDQNATHQLQYTNYPSLVKPHNSGQPEQKAGLVQSDVVPLGEDDCPAVMDLMYDSVEPTGSSIQFYIRWSDRLFDRNTPERVLPYHLIRNHSHKIPMVRYVQWKAVLKADPTGSYTPVLKDVAMHVSHTEIPARPVNLKVVEELSFEDRIVLQWSRDADSRIDENGGYIVYYGLYPGDYSGMIRFNGMGDETLPIRHNPDFPLSDDEKNWKQNDPVPFNRMIRRNVRMEITNDLILRNIRESRSGSHMPLLKPGMTYYFAVSSYTRFGGESELSPETVFVLRHKPEL